MCAETIYQAVYHGCLPVTARECLRTRRPRRRSRQVRHAHRRAGLPNINLRPAAVSDRTEPGHFELDLVIGKNNRSALVCGIERLTRYGAIVTLPEGYRAESVLAAMVELFDQIPPDLRGSVTFDQGSEGADGETLVATFAMKAFFCEPHSPWPRGAIKNDNGHDRYWFPRGTDHGLVTPAQADAVSTFLNRQRRRSLDGATAEQHRLDVGGGPWASPSTRRASGPVAIGG